MNTKTSAEAAATPTRAITLLAMAAFVSSANLRVCDALLPQIAGDLGVTVGSAAAVVTAFALAYGLLQVAVGPLGDARGKLNVLVLGCLWAGITTILGAVMPSLAPLVVLRFMAGAGGAAIIPLAIAWLGDVIPYEQRQPMLARFASGQILGVVFGQAAGGAVGELIGWRATMLLLGVCHIATALLLMAEIRRAMLGGAHSGRAKWRDAAALAASIVRRAWVRVVLIAIFLEGMIMYGAFAYVGAHLHHQFGIGFGTVGAILASFGIGALCYSLNAGVLVRRLGQPGLVALGSVFLAVGYGTLGVMRTLWLAPPAIVALGLGLYMLHNTLQTVATQMAPEARGLAISLFAFMLFSGQSAGVALAAPIVDRYGAGPIFLTSAVALPLVALWFRWELMRHHSREA
ncbi:MAG TPA: MFS transporter [Hyphomicrobiaceae bacterium]|nr:MFS transporter [Hyphomicrobiaceae bacterium]